LGLSQPLRPNVIRDVAETLSPLISISRDRQGAVVSIMSEREE
jgi:hypothetical protein